MNSYTPEYWDGGGGWSQIKFSLDSLWEQRQLVRNTWTKSNIAMPLCRYYGCIMKFYKQYDISYIVHYENCLPMVDTEQKHTNAQPSAMLMYKQKIIVPSKKLSKNKKPYIKKFIKPPPQLENKWYFQRDFCKVGLVMLTTTAIDLDRFYLNPQSRSNSITLYCLNTTIFTNRNFQQTDLGTEVWSPKPNYYMYGLQNGHQNIATTSRKYLTYLGQTQRLTPGIPIMDTTWNTYSQQNQRLENFGNPLHYNYLSGHSRIVVTTTKPSEFLSDSNRNTNIGTAATEMQQPIIVTCRYTPNKDNGIGNEIYLLKNTRKETGWDAPTDTQLQINGYPLWLGLWGWPDWQKKIHIAQQQELNYILVFKTDKIDQKLPAYVPLDYNFTIGHSPYEPDVPALPEDVAHWYPRMKYQNESINNICTTGPGVIKTKTTSIEAHVYYKFLFKWGGCPKDLENMQDPCQQPVYPIPNNQPERLEIQDPKTPPEYELYSFDFKRDIITGPASKRLKKDFSSETSPFADSAMSATPVKAQETQESSTEEETETPILEQLQQQRKLQHKLKRRIKQLINSNPHTRYTNLQ